MNNCEIVELSADFFYRTEIFCDIQNDVLAKLIMADPKVQELFDIIQDWMRSTPGWYCYRLQRELQNVMISNKAIG